MRSCLFLIALCCLAAQLAGCGGGGSNSSGGDGGVNPAFTVFGYNDLGMHCMNQDFSELAVLPPFNNLHAQVVRHGDDPRIVTSGVSVEYGIPGNTESATKTNFWDYAQALYGANLAANIGLTGNGMSGTMKIIAGGEWVATGIPITQMTDAVTSNSYQLATITVRSKGQVVAQTQAVVPVSWEMNCNLCHNTPGISTATDILRAHDTLHGTDLENQKPVLCGRCHRQEPLAPFGITGSPALPSLSRAMHGAHANRMAAAEASTGGNACYACHPGIVTQCLRDVHAKNGMSCTSCHGTMSAVASSARHPWIDEPRCGSCHNRAGFEFEQAGTLFRNSKGHHGITCEACHGSPHAVTPSQNAADNIQAMALQGEAGPIHKCTVCHTDTPDENFPHRFSGGD